MDHSAPRMPRSQEDQLAARWTKQRTPSEQGAEDEIIYLHLPSLTSPGKTYIFPLAPLPDIHSAK